MFSYSFRYLSRRSAVALARLLILSKLNLSEGQIDVKKADYLTASLSGFGPLDAAAGISIARR
jgi:hypothetical protein